MGPDRLLHILDTDGLEGDEVLVRFADGTTEVYEREELENLRIRLKRVCDDLPGGAGVA